LVLLDNFKDVISIAFGAAIGANTRFLIYKKFYRLKLSKNYITLLINTGSSFFLGLLISQVGSIPYFYNVLLFFSIGLLGSLSTFSAFIYELFDLFIQLKFYRLCKLLIISLVSGLLAFAAGCLLGMQ
tara:strand:- start:345 stop:728 length:384 start_codon:yes stop_codon:yes gene_type:complete